MGPEQRFQKRVSDELRKRGAFVVKYPAGPHGLPGTPDLLACHQGLFFALEIKNPAAPPSKREPTPIQARQLAKISDAGGEARVIASEADLTALLALLDKISAAHALAAEVLAPTLTRDEFDAALVGLHELAP